MMESGVKKIYNINVGIINYSKQQIFKHSIILFTSLMLFSCGYWEELSLLPETDSYTSWWDENWSRRISLTFDNSGQGALTDFPVCVRLNSSRIDYGSTQNSGQDIRFIDSDDTTTLSYEIEIWNESGESIVWVKVPQVTGNSSSDFIYMYYGNSATSGAEDVSAVWDDTYEMVWHCTEQPGGGSDIQDSTSNAWHGTTQNMEAGDRVSGAIGYGLSLDGSNEWIDVNSPDPGFFHDAFNIMIIEAWIRPSSTSSNRVIFETGGSTNGIFLGISSNSLRMVTRNGGAGTETAVASAYTDTVNYHYVVGIFDNGTLSRYLDSAAQSTACGYGTVAAHSGQPGFGCNADSDADGNTGGPNCYFAGVLDEIRLTGTSISSDWIAAQYQSMSDNFITYGSQVSY